MGGSGDGSRVISAEASGQFSFGQGVGGGASSGHRGGGSEKRFDAVRGTWV